MATHSSTLAWEIPWMEEPGRLQSMGAQRVQHNWATSLSLLTFMHWRWKWQPNPVFLPGEFHRQKSLAGYSPRGHKESDMTEQLSLIYSVFSEGQGSLVCCCVWGHKVFDTTEWLNNKDKFKMVIRPLNIWFWNSVGNLFKAIAFLYFTGSGIRYRI